VEAAGSLALLYRQYIPTAKVAWCPSTSLTRAPVKLNKSNYNGFGCYPCGQTPGIEDGPRVSYEYFGLDSQGSIGFVIVDQSMGGTNSIGRKIQDVRGQPLVWDLSGARSYLNFCGSTPNDRPNHKGMGGNVLWYDGGGFWDPPQYWRCNSGNAYPDRARWQ
jgi:hypothetical protein